MAALKLHILKPSVNNMAARVYTSNKGPTIGPRR